MSLVNIIDLPDFSEFIVVQLYHSGVPVLLCRAPDSRSDLKYYHPKVLESYLVSNNILFDTFVPNPYIPRWLAPMPRKEGVYEVVGMGYASADFSQKVLLLPYGNSIEYKLSVSKDFNELILQTMKELYSDWKVV